MDRAVDRVGRVPRVALRPEEAAEAVGVSADYFRLYIAAELRWTRRGRVKLVSVRELERWLDENASLTLPEAS